ncbi:hypothetical protein [Phaeodactylibacter xiamenensis]|uniref:hypothetical protein n=1 Tax=Phaeodactylibacter xiamenensis TaxID=1524460 RepID=UPI0024A80EE4|nr:hypothetical protein [Phaeodactylibacter xiamenensis]
MKIQFPLIALFFATYFSTLTAQEMWPGDANNNGVVNAVDVLYIGIAHGALGPERDDATTNWEAQPFELWGQTFADGTDYGYADADGDGEIEDDDITNALIPNFGLSQPSTTADGYSNAAPGIGAPEVTFTPSATLVEAGATINIGLSLGNLSQPLENFYGIALAMSYDNDLVEPTTGFEYDDLDNSWINADGAEIEDVFYKDELEGRSELALTRINQTTISGSGQVAEFSIIIEDIIVGLTVDTFRLRIDSVLLIDNNFKRIPAVPDTATIIIADDTTKLSGTRELSTLPARVFPNPASGQCYLKLPHSLSFLKLVDAYGHVIWQAPPTLLEHTTAPRPIPLHGLPPGIYQVQGGNSSGVFSRKLIVQ